MKLNKGLTVIFCGVAMLAACAPAPTRMTPVTNFERIQANDAKLFQAIGYDIVAETGHGYISIATGELTTIGDFGSGTDMCYVLKKVPDDQKVYKGCVNHVVNKVPTAPVIVGLKPAN